MALTPATSVIIVNFNTGSLLATAVSSLIDNPGVELIVVDNASCDDSLATLARLPKFDQIRVIKNKANLGFGHAVGQGAMIATGEYLCVLNPDAKLTMGALSQMIATSKSYQDQAIIAPRLLNDDGTPQASCYHKQSIVNAIKEFWLGQKGTYSKYLPGGNAPTEVDVAVAAAWLIPKAVWDRVGGFAEKYFLYFEDLDLCDRARAMGIPIIYDPQAKVIHAHGVSSRTNNKTSELFLRSANLYHGKLKKLIIDLIIKVGHRLKIKPL